MNGKYVYETRNGKGFEGMSQEREWERMEGTGRDKGWKGRKGMVTAGKTWAGMMKGWKTKRNEKGYKGWDGMIGDQNGWG